jgi:hypothetical protein
MSVGPAQFGIGPTCSRPQNIGQETFEIGVGGRPVAVLLGCLRCWSSHFLCRDDAGRLQQAVYFECRLLALNHAADIIVQELAAVIAGVVHMAAVIDFEGEPPGAAEILDLIGD